ncbi:hypothetical protein ACLBXM_18795 [Xanthobacteraceae bacterium A53D]
MLSPFIFDTSKGETPQSVARQRAFAAQIMGGMGQRPARNMGEGWGNAIASIGQGLAARAYNSQADAAEQAGQQQGDALQQQFLRYFTGGEAPSAPPPSSSPAAPAPGGMSAGFDVQPQAGEGAMPGLAQARSAYAEELKDPAIAARLGGLIQAEVGGQGAQAQQAFAESLLNRAAARGQTLDHAMGGSYWPAITHQRVAQYSRDPQAAAKHQQMLNLVLGGSNVSQFATGNASGTVGFNGGPQVSAFGGERFGIEGPDRAWADRMRGGGVQVASADPNFVPGMPAGGAGPQPPMPAPAQPPAPQQVAQAAPRPAQQPQHGRPDLGMLAQAAGNPWVPEETRALARSMLQQEMQRRQQAADPAYRMQQEQAGVDLALSQERLNQLRNPPQTPTNDMREYEFARRQGFNGTFQDYQIALKEAGRPSTSVNIDQKAQGALEKTLGEGVGKTFSTMYDEGAQAGQDIYQIDRLRGLLAQSDSGLAPALTNVAAGFGIKLGDGAGAGQAADAIISYLTPRMRVPGSGASSDKDLAMFKRALPALINTPEGNNMIIDTMQGLAEYKRAQGDIAGQVVMGEIDPKEAVRMIRALPDPYAQFKAAAQQQPGQSNGGWTTMPNGVRIREKVQ